MVWRCLVIVVGLVVLMLGLRMPAFAEITGSTHDFSAHAWNTTGEICKVCHTPHNAGSAIAPLWNHTLSTASYTTYSSTTLDASVPAPNSVSKACLSCHDGTVALNSFGGNGQVTDVLMAGPRMLGTDLANDHPISFTYDAALVSADGWLKDPTAATVSSLGGKTISSGLLYGGKTVECSSCHDVHRNKGDSPSAGKLLLVNNAKSALCLTCHNK